MEENKSDNEELLFSINELRVLVEKLNGLNISDCAGLDYQKSQFSEFYKNAFEENRINNDEYLLVSKNVIRELIPFVSREDVLVVVLDFSRINANVQEIFDELNLIPVLINYIGNNKYSSTEYNYAFLQDYLYSYFYNKCYSLLSNDEFEDLLILLKTDVILIESGHSEWIIRSIFSTFVKFNLFSKDQLTTLLEHFDASVTDKVKKRLES